MQSPPALPALKCGGCRKCCVGDTITLLPEDNPAAFKTRLGADGSRELLKKKNGNCVYLGSAGCQIYSRQPSMCRQFDCRKYAWAVAVNGTPEQRAERAEKPTIKEGIRRLAAAGVILPVNDSSHMAARSRRT